MNPTKAIAMLKEGEFATKQPQFGNFEIRFQFFCIGHFALHQSPLRQGSALNSFYGFEIGYERKRFLLVVIGSTYNLN